MSYGVTLYLFASSVLFIVSYVVTYKIFSDSADLLSLVGIKKPSLIKLLVLSCGWPLLIMLFPLIVMIDIINKEE